MDAAEKGAGKTPTCGQLFPLAQSTPELVWHVGFARSARPWGGGIFSLPNRGPCRPAAQAIALLAVHSAGRQPRDFLILFFLHLSVFPRVDSPQITRVVAQQADPRQKQGRLLASPELIIIGELSQNSTCSSCTVGGSGLESSTAGGEGEGSENNGAPACGANIVFARSGASIQWVHPKEQP